MDRVVVVGSSVAGLRACETLRSEGFTGAIALIGAEAEMPYDRPPLSKQYLAGEWEADRIRLRKPDAIESLRLDLRLGAPAVSFEAGGRCVTLADGQAIAGDGVIIATGSACRQLPGQPDADGIFEVRTLDDATRLRRRLGDGVRLVVIGAGFIGLEVAATARHAGCDVTVLEGAPAPMIRGLGAEMGEAAASVHGRHGVDVRCGVQVAAIEHAHGKVVGVLLGDGQFVDADVVVVGVGVAPATGWLEGSGLTLADGVVCDATMRAAAGVYAAGDCARWHNRLFDPHDDAVMRVEHWTNAAEQGAAAAKNLLAVARGDAPVAYEGVPFFWSDQFDSRIQFIGRAHGGDDVHIIAGSADGAFAAIYGWQGRLRGALGVSMPKMVMPFRALMARRASWDDALAKAGELSG
jgi:NADPH-dependent 2,4-dienoyl-CoA reductase/sulfur reductase-like enzyme